MRQSFPPLTTLIRVILFLALLGGASTSAWADTQLDVQGGWGGHLRADRWVPLFITASDRKPRNVQIRIAWPHGGMYSMQIRQNVTINASPRTFPLLVPMRSWAYDAVFVLTDSDTGKTLARFPPDDGVGQTFGSPGAGLNEIMVGVSGASTTLSSLKTASSNLTIGFLEPQLVPEVSLGFDSLDLLILNEPNFVHSTVGPAELSDATQAAIVDWVRAGGTLVLWPGDAGFPSQGPLVNVLPARLGERKNVALNNTDLMLIGLPTRFKSLPVYTLEPKAGAKLIPLLNAGQAIAYSCRLGLGRIVLAPISMGELPIDKAFHCRSLWSPLLKGIVPILAEESTTQASSPQLISPNDLTDTQADEQNENIASMQIANFLCNVPGAGKIGFSYIAAVLIGMMVIVGPVDWFVLKKLGQQPWTWVTTSGWIALITLGAVYAGHLFKSGTLHYKTLRTVEQVDDTIVSTSDYVAIYSPRTRMYQLQTPPDGWWQPAALNNSRGASLKLDMDFHQTNEGNTPDDMLVNVWSLRFLRADRVGSGQPMIAADLKLLLQDGMNSSRPRIVGTLTNLSETSLKNISVACRMGSGVFTLAGQSSAATVPSTASADLTALPAHATLRVDAMITPAPMKKLIEPNFNYRYYGSQSETPSEADLSTVAFNLNARRGHLMQKFIETGKFAEIHAEVENPAPPAMLAGPKEVEQHWQFLRALVELH